MDMYISKKISINELESFEKPHFLVVILFIMISQFAWPIIGKKKLAPQNIKFYFQE